MVIDRCSIKVIVRSSKNGEADRTSRTRRSKILLNQKSVKIAMGIDGNSRPAYMTLLNDNYTSIIVYIYVGY